MRQLSLAAAVICFAIGCAPSVPAPELTAARDAGAREIGEKTGEKIGDAGTGRDGFPDTARPDTAADRAGAAEPARDGPGREAAPDAVGTSPVDRLPDGSDAGPPARAPAAGDVALVEVLVDPAGSDLGREWVELQNLGDDELDLSGLHLSDGTTDVAVDGGRLAARAIVVLGQSADPAHNGGAPVDRAYGTRLQLNNDADSVAICVGACAGGLVLDRFAWDRTLGAAYKGHAVVIDRAAGKICPATAPFGTEGSFGTPGAPNPPCPLADAGLADAGGADLGEDSP